MKTLCPFGAGSYFLFDDGSVRVGISSMDARPIKIEINDLDPELVAALRAAWKEEDQGEAQP
jgi:hypothetical protein